MHLLYGVIARATTRVVYQAHRSLRKHRCMQVENSLEKCTRKTESLKRDAEDDVAGSKGIQIAGDITTHRDSHETRHNYRRHRSRGPAGPASRKKLHCVFREAYTASRKAYGERSVEPMDCFACGSEASLAATVSGLLYITVSDASRSPPSPHQHPGSAPRAGLSSPLSAYNRS